MQSFLYFIPTAKCALMPDDVRAAGLGYALNDAGGPACNQTHKGPGDLAGVVFTIEPAAGGETMPPLYKPEIQTWRKGPGGKFWVGFQKDTKPGPDDLKRERIIAGEPVTLRDGLEWTIPICRSIVRGSKLPKALVFGEENQVWELQTLPEFLKLCADAETVYQAWRESHDDPEHEVKMNRQEACRIAADAMAVNYRVGPIEISMLGLWSTEEMWAILHAMIDGPNVERVAIEHQKKSESALPDVPPVESGAAA